MKDLDHPNVMKLIGICWGKKIICNESEQQILCGPLIVLPYTEMSDLRGYLRGKRRLASSSTDSYVNVPNVCYLVYTLNLIPQQDVKWFVV